MRASHRVFGWACFVLAVGCSTSDRFADGGPGADGGEDASSAGGGGGDGDPGPRFGAACEANRDCGRNLVCDTEVDLTFDVQSGDEVPSTAFPGGVCTPIAAAPFDPNAPEDACDPLGPPRHQGCGPDGVCVSVAVADELLLACRPACEPQADASGCARDFYTCDFDLHACVEGCQSDAECRLQLTDQNGDGQVEVVVDEDSDAFCDLTTYRCTHRAAGAGQTGDPCERHDDCEPDGTCIQPLQTFAGMPFPGGSCTKSGCDVDGRECTGDDAVCERLRPWDPGFITAHACFQRCTVGAEPEADRIGPDGHGEGCREGYRCHYNGGSGADSGVCVGGNYNEVAASNLGVACENDEECYSPFGLGSCLLLGVGTIRAPSGSCSIMDCNAPGLPDDVCGPGGECIALAGDVTFCVKTCKGAEDCAEGFACADDDLDPTTASICYPACRSDEECRKNAETCSIAAGAVVGSCVASGG